MIDGTANGPGTMVTLPHDEAAFLTARGFLQTEPPILAPAMSEPNPAAIGPHGGKIQGPVFSR